MGSIFWNWYGLQHMAMIWIVAKFVSNPYHPTKGEAQER